MKTLTESLINNKTLKDVLAALNTQKAKIKKEYDVVDKKYWATDSPGNPIINKRKHLGNALREIDDVIYSINSALEY